MWTDLFLPGGEFDGEILGGVVQREGALRRVAILRGPCHHLLAVQGELDHAYWYYRPLRHQVHLMPGERVAIQDEPARNIINLYIIDHSTAPCLAL